MCLLQLVGLEASFTHRIAPTGPVLTVPDMAANAGVLFEASPAKRHPAVCCCGALDFALDMVAIHVEKISTGSNRRQRRERRGRRWRESLDLGPSRRDDGRKSLHEKSQQEATERTETRFWGNRLR